jgi:hypothetical protein
MFYRANSLLYVRNHGHENEWSALSARVLSTSLYVPIFQIFTGSLKRVGEGFRRAMILRLFLNGSDGFALAATLKIPQGPVQPRQFDAVRAEQPT